jgi:uncharacterized protein (TIGR02118 family)
MVKFTILFRKPLPTKQEFFENTYQDFLALVERMPLIQRRQVNHILGSPAGASPYTRVLEVYFEDYDKLQEALNSPAGQEAGAELYKLGAPNFVMFFAEVFEETGGSTPQPSTDETANDEKPVTNSE